MYDIQKYGKSDRSYDEVITYHIAIQPKHRFAYDSNAKRKRTDILDLSSFDCMADLRD